MAVAAAVLINGTNIYFKSRPDGSKWAEGERMIEEIRPGPGAEFRVKSTVISRAPPSSSASASPVR